MPAISIYVYPNQFNYPLVNVHSLQWKDPPFLMGKSTISTGPCSIAMLVHQRVIVIRIYFSHNYLQYVGAIPPILLLTSKKMGGHLR